MVNMLLCDFYDFLDEKPTINLVMDLVIIFVITLKWAMEISSSE